VSSRGRPKTAEAAFNAASRLDLAVIAAYCSIVPGMIAGSPSDGFPSKLCAMLAPRDDCAWTGTTLQHDDRCIGTAQAPILIDVPGAADVAASDRCIVAAFHRAPSRRGDCAWTC
jgi:hypothetical protein